MDIQYLLFLQSIRTATGGIFECRAGTAHASSSGFSPWLSGRSLYGNGPMEKQMWKGADI